MSCIMCIMSTQLTEYAYAILKLFPTRPGQKCWKVIKEEAVTSRRRTLHRCTYLYCNLSQYSLFFKPFIHSLDLCRPSWLLSTKRAFFFCVFLFSVITVVGASLTEEPPFYLPHQRRSLEDPPIQKRQNVSSYPCFMQEFEFRDATFQLPSWYIVR